jgi:hypothetical protein
VVLSRNESVSGDTTRRPDVENSKSRGILDYILVRRDRHKIENRFKESMGLLKGPSVVY